MAIINCPECQKTISSNAISCPHCGYNIQGFIDRERADLEFEQLAKQVKKPPFPLLNPLIILDVVISLLIIIIIMIMGLGFKMAFLLCLVSLTILQVCFLQKITQIIRDYRYANSDFINYQRSVIETDMRRLESKKQNFTIPYIASFLIPIIGIILGIKYSTNHETKYAGVSCFVIGITSIFIYALIVSL